MPRALDQVIDKLPEDERAKIEARAQELIAEEMSLRNLRKAIGKTQQAVAKRLKVGQDAVSKIETRSDCAFRPCGNSSRRWEETWSWSPNSPTVRRCIWKHSGPNPCAANDPTRNAHQDQQQ